MKTLIDCLSIKISQDNMIAEVYCLDENYLDAEDINMLKSWISEQNVTKGIDNEIIENILSGRNISDFPVVIAKGKSAQNGIDGKVEYEFNHFEDFAENIETYDFREVMKIPSVNSGEKLAYYIPPTEGEDGFDVCGNKIQARTGKPETLEIGKNVFFDSKKNTYYSLVDGQVSITERKIMVNVVYEINETISLRTGNINFVGSIIIHGDVPSGYRIKAGGDIKVFGMVEAANLTAVGNIFISEGLSGMKKGMIKAGGDVHINYINQGTVQADQNIFVENSILHSTCTAFNAVISKNGNIIGGLVSAGRIIEAKDVGNRLNTKTEICFGLNESHDDQEEILLKEKQELLEQVERLKTLGSQIENMNYEEKPKLRIALLRQRNKMNSIHSEIIEIDETLEQMKLFVGLEKYSKLKVHQNLYPNTLISFGKYKQTIQKDHYQVQFNFENNEISMKTL